MAVLLTHVHQGTSDRVILEYYCSNYPLYYRMIDIEELSIKLSQCQSFRQFIRSQLVQSMQSSLAKNSQDKGISLSQLTRQIAGQILQITQFVLEEENSSNFMSLMRNNQEMCAAIQKRMQLEFQEKLHALNRQLQQLTLKLENYAANTERNNTNTDSMLLKQERKIITKSILNNSRLITNTKTKSSITRPLLRQAKFDSYEFESNNKQIMETNDSSYRVSIQDNNCYDLDSLENHPVLYNLRSKIEQTTNQTLKMQQSLVSLSQKVDIKLENSLQGLWNVLGDLNVRVAKIQSKLHEIEGIDLQNE